MHDHSRPQAHQRPLPFRRLDLWEQFPEPIRQQCQELYVQLLQAVIESETLPIGKTHQDTDEQSHTV